MSVPQEEHIQKMADALIPILERESNMVWGPRTAENIVRWTLLSAGLTVIPKGCHYCPGCGQHLLKPHKGWCKFNQSNRQQQGE